MNGTPNVKYYASMVLNTTKGVKTPKYTITRQCGYMPEMDLLRGKDGKISMYLMEKLKEGDNVPSIRLQAKNSLNFSGLKEWFVDGGKLSGHAYGYPLNTPTFSRKGKPNPLFGCKDDGFLFLAHYDKDQEQEVTLPQSIELIVISGAKPLISAYCKMLVMGGFNETLEQLRKQAQP